MTDSLAGLVGRLEALCVYSSDDMTIRHRDVVLRSDLAAILTEARASAEAPLAAPLVTECCGVSLNPNHRYCPKCGYECRVEVAVGIPLVESVYGASRRVWEAPLAAVRPPQEWQAIEGYDKAIHPLDVLVATAHGVGEARQHDDGAYGRWFWANTCDDGAPGPGEIYPTHWMPLPSPPVAVERRPAEVGIEEQKHDEDPKGAR